MLLLLLLLRVPSLGAGRLAASALPPPVRLVGRRRHWLLLQWQKLLLLLLLACSRHLLLPTSAAAAFRRGLGLVRRHRGAHHDAPAAAAPPAGRQGARSRRLIDALFSRQVTACLGQTAAHLVLQWGRAGPCSGRPATKLIVDSRLDFARSPGSHGNWLQGVWRSTDCASVVRESAALQARWTDFYTELEEQCDAQLACRPTFESW